MFNKAFITDSILENADGQLPVVVTARRLTNGKLAIYIAPTNPPQELCGLLITITSHDLLAVQELLGEERPMFSADDEGVVPDEDIAWHALRQIADLDQIKEEMDGHWTWKDVALRAIDYAQEALVSLEEDDDGTATDS